MDKYVHTAVFASTAKQMNYTHADPKNILAKAYQMPTITDEECRTVFLSWIMSVDDQDVPQKIELLYKTYAPLHPDHTLTNLLKDGL